MAALALAACAGLLPTAHAQDTAAARTQALERCADGRHGPDARAYCTAYADFVTRMSPVQQQRFDQALRACSASAAAGTPKWTCEQSAYEAARRTGSVVDTAPATATAAAATPGTAPPMPPGVTLEALTAPPPPGPLGIDQTFMDERAADRRAALTLRVPVVHAGLPAVDELRQLMRPDEVLDGEPRLIVRCIVSMSGQYLSAVASLPWVENGAERRELVTLRYHERFGNGSPASRAGEFQCASHFGIRRADGSLRIVELIAARHAGLCGLVPGEDLGRDDSCAAVGGELVRAQPGQAFRQWFGTFPEGTSDGLEMLPAPTPP
ncbi:MAG: hypothetical protein ACLGIT_02775 [Gammaproteobacteria bacterium]